MQPPGRTTGAAQTWEKPDEAQAAPVLHWCVIALAACCIIYGAVMLAMGPVLPATGAMGAGAALAITWGRPPHRRCPPPRQANASLDAPQAAATPLQGNTSVTNGNRSPAAAPWSSDAGRARPKPGDPDLYLDLGSVEVHAVYVLGAELFTHLRGGSGERRDPATGDRRYIQTSDVSLTWRCPGKRAAARLAEQLNMWEARHTPLRLLAPYGRSALLMENDDNWLLLPELRLTT